jgi:NAD(P)-dependent dehydrogenase (short-subunit alcohol dehydrogenase family)
VLARGRDGLEATRDELPALGAAQALAIECDVAESAQVFAAAHRIEQELGPIDIWINNAMTTVFGRFRTLTPEQFERVTRVTYLGFVWGTRAALDWMVPRNRGTIVQVGSALAYRSIPLQSAYCAAKHAIAGFTDSLRCELIHDDSRIHVTMVQMPALNTPQFGWVKSRLTHKAQPVPPIYQPEVAADAIYWAAHHRRRELYVGASTVEAIVANKIAPGVLDHYLGRTGYASQQTQALEDPNRPNNLWEPVAGDAGAHGAFDARATDQSRELWAATHVRLIGLTLLGAAAGACAALSRGAHGGPGRTHPRVAA